MKKLVLVAIMMLVPFTSFALDAMNDGALDEITAQEGVTITFDNVVVNQAGSNIAWGDNDGTTVVRYDTDTNGDGVIDNSDTPTTTTTDGGYIFISQDSGNTITLDGTSLTIDVATATSDITVGDATIEDGTTFVAIGLPSVTVGATQKTTTISMNAYMDNDGDGAIDFPEAGTTALGSLYQHTTGNTTITGSVYIYAHN